jgi:uncharacterized membrane protein required for colicin V production
MNIKNIGLIILILAAALLIGNGVYHLIMNLLIDTDLSLIVKIGIFGLIIGLIIIIIGLIIERVKDKKDEQF